MNPAIITLLRYVLQFGGGVLVAKGTIDADTLEQVIGAIITLVMTGFGVWVNIKNNAKIKELK